MDIWQWIGTILICILILLYSCMLIISVWRLIKELKEEYYDMLRLYQYTVCILYFLRNLTHAWSVMTNLDTNIVEKILLTGPILIIYLVFNQIVKSLMIIHIENYKAYIDKTISFEEVTSIIRRKERGIVMFLFWLIIFTITMMVVKIIGVYYLWDYKISSVIGRNSSFWAAFVIIDYILVLIFVIVIYWMWIYEFLLQRALISKMK